MGGRLFDWFGAGAAIDRPAAVDMPALLVSPGSTAFYFATDTKILGVFDESGPSWFDIDATALAGLLFATLPDVDMTGVADGDVVKWDNGSSKFIPLTLGAIPTTEQIQDIVGAMISNDPSMDVTYDDALGLLVFASLITQYTDELAQDALAAAFAGGSHTGLTITYNDVSNTFDFDVTITQYTDPMVDARIALAILADLADVDAGSPADGDVLTYDSGTGRYAPAAPTGGGGGGGGSTPVIRGYTPATVFNSNTANIPIPTGVGVIADDVMFAWFVNGYLGQTITQAGWSFLHQGNNGYTNGCLIAKVLTAGDLATGFVTVTTTGAYYGSLAAVVLEGPTVESVHKVVGEGTTGSAQYNTALVPGFPEQNPNDLIFGFAATRGNDTHAGSAGLTALGANAANADASGRLWKYTGTKGIFGVSELVTITGGNNGLYHAWVAVGGP